MHRCIRQLTCPIEVLPDCSQTVDLFKYRFVFVPIHDHLHWSLAVICNAGNAVAQGQPNAPFILHLDSLKGAHPCLISCW